MIDMTIDDCKKNLQQKFDVLCFIDIADIAGHPGKPLEIFRSLHREHFEENQRLIFYSYYPIQQNFIEYLYKCANFIDISNFFILLITPENIKNQLETCCKNCSTDKVSFQNIVISLPITKKIIYNFELPETVCAIPWSHLQITTTGKITPCCMATNIELGNIENTTLKEAFSSKTLQKFRDRFLKGERPEECNYCWKLEDQNLSSIRTHNISRLKEDFFTEYLNEPKITSLDIKFGNACNFKCRICSSSNSSLFNIEEHKHKGTTLITQTKWEESHNFLNQIVDLLPKIKNIDMYGGEPFLLKKFKKVLEIAIAENYSKNIRLHYNSNGSVWPKEFINLWPSFKEVNILFSIDNIGKRFELERGGTWESVEKNILDLKNLNIPNLKINIMPSIGAMNVFYISELYDWATKHDFNLFVSHVRSQKGLDLSDLTKEAQDLIIEKYHNHPWNEMRNLAKALKKIPASDGKKFCETIAWFDKIRKENFSETHPEIAQAMRYTV